MPKKVDIATGFGYMKNEKGEIVAKYDLPPGEHIIDDGLDIVELATLEALDVVTVAAPSETPAAAWERKINAEIRAMAIERLTAKGEVAPQ